MNPPDAILHRHRSEVCTRTFRNRSLPAIALALCAMLFFAWWAMVDPELDASSPPPEPAATAALGGVATGSDAAGTGTGATNSGFERDVAAVDPDEKPRGDTDNPVNQQEEIASGNDAPETLPALPRIGFTPPEDPPVAAPKVTPVLAAPGGQGRGGTGGRVGGTGTSFMGVETNAQRICYILDFSGSMFGAGVENPKIAHMLLELKKSVNRLPDDHSFYVIFFDDTELPMGGTSMVKATSNNRSKWFTWADVESVGANARGGTDPSGALEFALKNLKPDAIYLLTDGGFDNAASFAVINLHNANRATQINTIGFHDRSNEAGMQQIASENRGEYRYIPPPAGSPVP